MTELGHAAFYVRNLERSVAFYQKVVGLSVVGRIFNGRAAILSGGKNHHELLLIQISVADGPLMGRRIGLYHMGWKVGGCFTELQKALDRAQTYGVKIEGTADHGVMFSLYVRDPDGNEVELFVDNPDCDWRTDSSWMEAPVKPLDLSVPYQHRAPPASNVRLGLHQPAPRQQPTAPPVSTTPRPTQQQQQMQTPPRSMQPQQPTQAQPTHTPPRPVQPHVQVPVTPRPAQPAQVQPTPAVTMRPVQAHPQPTPMQARFAQVQPQPPQPMQPPVPVPPRPVQIRPAAPATTTVTSRPITPPPPQTVAPPQPAKPAPVVTAPVPVQQPPIQPPMEQDNVHGFDAMANYASEELPPTGLFYQEPIIQEVLPQIQETIANFVNESVTQNQYFQSEAIPDAVQPMNVEYETANAAMNVGEEQTNVSWVENELPIEMFQNLESSA